MTQPRIETARQLRKAGYASGRIYGIDTRRIGGATVAERIALSDAYAERVTALLPTGFAMLGNGTLWSNADADWTLDVDALVSAAQSAAFAA